jgi:hypothetical protein
MTLVYRAPKLTDSPATDTPGPGTYAKKQKQVQEKPKTSPFFASKVVRDEQTPNANV